jgi:hypothetical protein
MNQLTALVDRPPRWPGPNLTEPALTTRLSPILTDGSHDSLKD